MRAGGVAHILVPVTIVAGVLASLIGIHLATYGGNLTGFIQFGSHYAGATHPPPGALVKSPLGYDGQFFYVQALDPLLLHDSTVSGLRAAHAAFRMQRAAYPALAFLLAGGRPGAVPLALLAVNVLVLLALTAGFAQYARRRGWSTLWAVAIALMPGMLLPVLRDLSDPLSTACLLAGILSLRGGRRWPAALALTIAVLSREMMMLAIAAVAAEAALRAWRARDVPGAWRSIALWTWPVVAIPTAAFGAWQIYITARYGGPVGTPSPSVPIVNLAQEVWWSLHTSPVEGLWDLVYVALILAAVLAAVGSVRHRATLTSLGACAVALAVLLPTLGDVWSDTRLSAPLFALLLIDGLHRRHRPSVVIGAAAAAMSLLVPFAILGTV